MIYKLIIINVYVYSKSSMFMMFQMWNFGNLVLKISPYSQLTSLDFKTLPDFKNQKSYLSKIKKVMTNLQIQAENHNLIDNWKNLKNLNSIQLGKLYRDALQYVLGTNYIETHSNVHELTCRTICNQIESVILANKHQRNEELALAAIVLNDLNTNL